MLAESLSHKGTPYFAKIMSVYWCSHHAIFLLWLWLDNQKQIIGMTYSKTLFSFFCHWCDVSS